MRQRTVTSPTTNGLTTKAVALAVNRTYYIYIHAGVSPRAPGRVRCPVPRLTAHEARTVMFKRSCKKKTIEG